MKKHFYEAPEAELLLVRFEKNILSDPLSSSSFGDSKADVEDMSSSQDIWHYMNQ